MNNGAFRSVADALSALKSDQNANSKFQPRVNANGTVSMASVAQENPVLKNMANFKPAEYMTKAISELKMMGDQSFM